MGERAARPSRRQGLQRHVLATSEYSQHLIDRGQPAGTPGRIALPVAGDDPKDKATVMGLVDELGFDPVEGGTIDESWRQQPGAPVYAADLDAEAATKALAVATPERRADFSA